MVFSAVDMLEDLDLREQPALLPPLALLLLRVGKVGQRHLDYKLDFTLLTVQL